MQNKLLWGAILISVGVAVFCRVYLMEKYETQIWEGASQKAQRNPFLAAQRFLEKRGVNVVKTTDVLDFKNISTEQTVLLTEVDGMLVSQSQIDNALAWIAAGGYMIVGVSKELQGNFSLLKHFDIEPEKIEVEINDTLLGDDGKPKSASERMREINRELEEAERTKEKDAPNSSPDSATDENSNRLVIDEDDEFNEQLFDLLNTQDEHQYYRLNTEGEDHLAIAVLDRIILNHDLIFESSDNTNLQQRGYTLNTWSSDEHGQRMLQFFYGEGSFIAISSTELWENDYIGLADHAYFLSYLVPDKSTLQLFYNLDVPSLFTLLKRYFSEFLWSSALLLLLWLWFRGIRTQRVIKKTSASRRSFAEHLQSSAHFLVQNEQFSTLTQAIKEDIEQQLNRHHPNFSQLNDASKASIMIEKTNLPEAVIGQWLNYCTHIENREQLVAALQISNAIRKQL